MDANSTPRDLTKAETREIFTNEAQTIIHWKGANFYKACDILVRSKVGGGKSYCVKRVNHHGDIHEDWDGNQQVSRDLQEVTHESTQ